MSVSEQEGILPLHENMEELMIKLVEVLEDLIKLNKITINLLAQYMNVEEYEEILTKITSGDDVIF